MANHGHRLYLLNLRSGNHGGRFREARDGRISEPEVSWRSFISSVLSSWIRIVPCEHWMGRLDCALYQIRRVKLFL